MYHVHGNTVIVLGLFCCYLANCASSCCWLEPSRAHHCFELWRHDHSRLCSLTHAAQKRHVPQQTPLRLASRSLSSEYTGVKIHTYNRLAKFPGSLILFIFICVSFPGTDIKGGMVAPHPELSTTMEEHTAFYFSTYSRDFLVKVANAFNSK